MVRNNLVPELSVSHLENSLKFYGDILGFKIEFARAEDRFAYLSFHGSALMFEEDSGRQSPWHILPFDNDMLRGQRNFLVLDPDGCLLRFAQKLGTRPVEELGRGV